jgi:hypothetical protein
MRSRWSDDDQAGYRKMLAEAASREAVRAAEEVVGDAWLATLSDAVEQTAADQRVCTHMRDTAYMVVKSAESGRESGRESGEISASHKELAVSQRALAQVRRRHAVMRQFADQERQAWAVAAKARRLEAIAERDRLRAASPEAASASAASSAGASADDGTADAETADAPSDAARQDRAG